MLKLRRIELIGFKSFSDRGEITVHDNGVTAIVGPNGCGKSNVSDAIAWVLGEQSAKSLRGEKMEDVIFNGTRNRAPMGMAEVTITLTEMPNGNGQTQPRDISVQRRLYRSGESVYLIDGRRAGCAISRRSFSAPVSVPTATRSSNRAASANCSARSRPTGAR
jgi:chromosome segregation protein